MRDGSVLQKQKWVVAKRKEVPRIIGEHDSKRREEVDTRRDSTDSRTRD